jgi:glutamine cyclotransferase
MMQRASFDEKAVLDRPVVLRWVLLYLTVFPVLVPAPPSQTSDNAGMEFSQHPYFWQMAKRAYADSANSPAFSYRVVSSFPHDPTAFTQGLAFENGFLYEGTGLRGASTIREVQLETGDIVRIRGLADRYFGEGITISKNRIVQLTWTSNLGFIYDRNTFEPVQEFRYSIEGWGITNDNECLIMSDGSARLYFIDPETFFETHRIEAHDQQGPLYGLNELEYVRGQVFANVWPTEFVARIDPATGRVAGWVDLRGILTPEDRGNHRVDVLNGIAYDAVGDRLFVTGKWWPRLYEIELVRIGVRP